MNIGILISRLTKTGPVNVVYNIIHETNDNLVKFTIFTFRNELSNNTRIRDFEKMNIPVYCIHNKNIIKMRKNLEKEIKLHNIDILHAHCFRSLIISSFIKLKKIFTIHQNFYYEWKSRNQFKYFGKIMIFLQDKLLRKWDIIIVCAQHLKKILMEKMPEKGIFCVVNGVIHDQYESKSKIKKDKKRFVYIGSIDTRKNVKELCREFSSSALDDEELICVGSGHDLPMLQKMNYSKIKFFGFQDNISEILCQSDYFISMSTSEGLPLAVIEALSCKLPVILSDIPAHRDFFSLNENIGVLITDGLDKALKKIRMKNYKEMSEDAFKMYADHLTAKKMSEEYVKLYRDLHNYGK